MENTKIIIYQTEDGKTKIETRLEEETVWLTIGQMAELFQKSRSTINEHILNIYEEQELDTEQSMRKIGNSDFSTKPTNYYNLDVIISVGSILIKERYVILERPSMKVNLAITDNHALNYGVISDLFSC